MELNRYFHHYIYRKEIIDTGNFQTGKIFLHAFIPNFVCFCLQVSLLFFLIKT